MGKGSKVPKCLKICCGITALIIIIILVVSIALYFTILKPKEPKITTQSVFLEDIKLVPLPFHLNVTLGLVVTINNRNYGSFRYKNSTAYVTYRGTLAAEAPIKEDTIPARGKLDVGTTVVIEGEKLVLNPTFWTDYFSGCLNFTSSTTLHGKATMLKFLKIKATTFSTCDISVFVLAMNATSVCSSSVKGKRGKGRVWGWE
ncbi:hypothetical protein LguiB_005132 [Lonicera macranthoides]